MNVNNFDICNTLYACVCFVPSIVSTEHLDHLIWNMAYPYFTNSRFITSCKAKSYGLFFPTFSIMQVFCKFEGVFRDGVATFRIELRHLWLLAVINQYTKGCGDTHGLSSQAKYIYIFI